MSSEQVLKLALLEEVTKAGKPQIKTRSDGKQFVSVDWLAIVDLIYSREQAATKAAVEAAYEDLHGNTGI